MTSKRLDNFSAVEVMYEFSKAMRQAVISLESLNELVDVDRKKVSVLAEAVGRAYDEATAYMVTLIGADSAAQSKEPNVNSAHA
jgi:hypothetical protein